MISISGASVNGSDLSLYYSNGGDIYRSTYTGNFRPAVNQEGIAMSPGALYSAASMNQLMKAFDPSLDDRYYACSFGVPGPGQYSLIQCNRGIQNSYGWVGAFYGGDGRAITANWTDRDPRPRVVREMKAFSAPA